MRITKLAVVAVGLTLGLAACTSSGSSESATPSASGSGSSTVSGSGSGGSTGGVASSCVVGNWKGNGVNATFDSGGVHGSTTGGGGLVVRVSRDGKTVLDFTSMQPVTFSTAVNSTEIKGSFVYGGTATGNVGVSDATATKGTWRPIGTVD